MILEDIHRRDRPFGGAKGLIYIGGTLLATIRDNHTNSFPGYLDLIGGGREYKREAIPETPFETFSREAWEEVNLDIRPRHITYAHWYASQTDARFTGVMLVAHLPASAGRHMQLGDEGSSIEHLQSLPQLLARTDLIPVLHHRTEEYAQYIGAANQHHVLAA